MNASAQSNPPSVPGRGAPSNPANRFEKLHLENDLDTVDGEPSVAPGTQFLRDQSASILAHNDSPDVGFDTSINAYRGCEHGCIYCYARPTHEYLGLSAGLDFESKIMVKERAPELLRRELSSPKWKPRVIAMSGVTDCYQPIERKLKLTRGCLEVLADCRNPVVIITKNFLVTRDIDLLQELARFQAVSVCLSVTTLDAGLARVMEPRTSSPRQRLAAIQALSAAGVPVGVNVAPIIPGLTDHEILPIVQACVDAGAKFAGYTVVRLPHAVKDLFAQWLDAHAPGQKDKILNRIRAMRDGKLNVSEWGSRMKGEGIFADQIAQTFAVALRKTGLANTDRHALSAASFRRPLGAQLSLEL
ncbi:MAG TPA: PA0069 family radical SAM protein [Verrucomicrobiae bacterium]|jgi:DNA repair photolyase|nr:PA0069 family radical SAM protein [Verrucomicrobiae bacterium]